MDCRFSYSKNCLRDQFLGNIEYECINGKERRCGKSKIRGIMGNVQIVIHWLPWGTYIDVIWFSVGGIWVRLFAGKWDIFKDYNWQLDYFFGDEEE